MTIDDVEVMNLTTYVTQFLDVLDNSLRGSSNFRASYCRAHQEAVLQDLYAVKCHDQRTTLMAR